MSMNGVNRLAAFAAALLVTLSVSMPAQAGSVGSAELREGFSYGECMSKREITGFLKSQGIQLRRILGTEWDSFVHLEGKYEDGNVYRYTVSVCDEPYIVEANLIERPAKGDGEGFDDSNNGDAIKYAGCVTEVQIFRFLKKQGLKPERILTADNETIRVRAIFQDGKRYDYSVVDVCTRMQIDDSQPSPGY